jgi:hypothetical protein
MKMDGYAFCLGIDQMKDAYKTRPELNNLVRSVTYLIKGAIFRPTNLATSAGRPTLNISPLNVLVDMYHTQEATDCRDKVFALLGMSTDDLSEGHLTPDYSLPWGELLQRLIKHIISEDVCAETWNKLQASVIKSKGCILGEIVSVENDLIQDNQPNVTVGVSPSNVPIHVRGPKKTSGHWTLQATARNVQVGDFVCLLRGASRPSIVRLRKDYFTLVVVAITFSEETRKKGKVADWSTIMPSKKLPDRNFLIVWDWEQPPQGSPGPKAFGTWIRTMSWGSKESKVNIDQQSARARRAWDVTLILGDLAALPNIEGMLRREATSRMEERGKEAVEKFEMAIERNGSYILRSQTGKALLILT